MARFFYQDAAIQNFIDNLSDVECNDEGDEGSCDEGILAFYYVFFNILSKESYT